jgi:hypothetical protein
MEMRDSGSIWVVFEQLVTEFEEVNEPIDLSTFMGVRQRNSGPAEDDSLVKDDDCRVHEASPEEPIIRVEQS